MTTEPDQPAQLPHPWSSDALLSKAVRYAEQMQTYPADDWRFVLWSTFAVEFLSRAALANVSPTLVADAKTDWNQTYFALGYSPTAPKFQPKSIDITEVLKRLQDMLPELTPELRGIAEAHMARRNEELHSGSTALDTLGTSAWLAGVYQVCVVLLGSMGHSLDELLGDREATVAEEMIAAAADESGKAVKKDIEAHHLVWKEKPDEERQRLALQASTWATRHDGHGVGCPACSSDAMVTGAAISAPVPQLDADQIVETQQFLPSQFECVACGLKVSGLSRLGPAGLADLYTATQRYAPSDYYGMVEEFDGYEPDFNEPGA